MKFVNATFFTITFPLLVLIGTVQACFTDEGVTVVALAGLSVALATGLWWGLATFFILYSIIRALLAAAQIIRTPIVRIPRPPGG